MKKIYIILMHTNSFPSRLVRIFTRYKFSHVAISFQKECNEIYSFGRRKLNEPLNGGFVKENKNGEFFKYFNKTECKICELNITDSQYDRALSIIKEIEKNKDNYKYDFIGVILRFLKIPITIKNRYVCSYFIAQVLEDANIYKFNKKKFFVEPKDFEKIKQMREIYKGKYCLY